MPPSTVTGSWLPRGILQQHLSKLYSDTKQSYEAAKVTEESINANDEPETVSLKKELQIQQDRLLAWGMQWADFEAQSQGHEVYIDKKLHDAGLGEVVASIMSEIKGLLDQGGRLQHPERYEHAKRGKSVRSPPSPKLLRKDRTMHEGTTGRELLGKLTNCIDVLYSLSEQRRTAESGEKGAKKMRKYSQDTVPSSVEQLYEHRLYIDMERFELLTYAQETEPPPYGAETDAAAQITRSICIDWDRKMYVLVDFLSGEATSLELENPAFLEHWMDFSDKLCAGGSLATSRHLKLLGFTVNRMRMRLGFVYAVSTLSDQAMAKQHKTLTACIAASHSLESSQPHLEDRYRLAYNLTLSTLSYICRNERHQHINSSNVLFMHTPQNLRSTSTGPEIRQPYLLYPLQKLVSGHGHTYPIAPDIYRHPEDDGGEKATPAHDIYSLGLILLEVGLWVPLSKLWKSKYDRETFRERLQRIYSAKLASKCGSKYMRIVRRCLEAPGDFPTESHRLGAAMSLVETANELSKCCAIDEEGPPPASDLDYFQVLALEQIKDRTPDILPEKTKSVSSAQAQETNDGDSSDIDAKSKEVQPETKKSVSPLRKWSGVNVPQNDLDQWNKLLMPRLSKILQDALHDSLESCSLRLMMAGSTPETAKTTICVECPDTSKIRNALQQRFRPRRGWNVVVCKGDVRRSGKTRRPRRAGRGAKSTISTASVKKLPEQHYQEKPAGGASIGAFKGNEHLPPVSFGGTILLDGEPYGMTVHHMLDDPSDEEEDHTGFQEAPRRAAAPQSRASLGAIATSPDLMFMRSDDNLPDMGELDISDDEDMSDSDTSTIRPDYCIEDEDGDEFWFLDNATPELEDDNSDDSAASSTSSDEDDAASIGDRLGVGPDDDDELSVTQPAIDDVDEDFFPSAEDRDDDHLSSHSFGYVHASSGIRRIMSGQMKHEVDWALIRVNEERLQLGNTIKNDIPRRKTKTKATPTRPEPHLTSIAPMHTLSGTAVHCQGRSSGFKTGRISQAMALVKFHGRRSFSSSWCVEGGFGIPGDSGKPYSVFIVSTLIVLLL